MDGYDEQDDLEIEERSDGADEILRYLDDQPTTAFNLAFELGREKDEVIEVAEGLVDDELLETRYSGADLRGHDRIYSLTEEGEECLDEFDV